MVILRLLKYLRNFLSLQIALQLVRQGVSNEPDQESLGVTVNEESNSGDSITAKDEIVKDPAVEDASVANNVTNPASEEANEVNLTTEAPKEDSTSKVVWYLFVLLFFSQTKHLHLILYCPIAC
jgi:fructose-1,6-bisphosphatase